MKEREKPDGTETEEIIVQQTIYPDGACEIAVNGTVTPKNSKVLRQAAHRRREARELAEKLGIPISISVEGPSMSLEQPSLKLPPLPRHQQSKG